MQFYIKQAKKTDIVRERGCRDLSSGAGGGKRLVEGMLPHLKRYRIKIFIYVLPFSTAKKKFLI